MDRPVTTTTEEPRLPAARNDEEALVSDSRSGLRPAQIVERKLASMLQTGVLPFSRLQDARPPRALA